MNYEDCTDNELIILYLKAANDLSYYNAAEGSDWYAEADARFKCQRNFNAIYQEFKNRNLEKPQGDWLI